MEIQESVYRRLIESMGDSADFLEGAIYFLEKSVVCVKLLKTDEEENFEEVLIRTTHNLMYLATAIQSGTDYLKKRIEGDEKWK